MAQKLEDGRYIYFRPYKASFKVITSFTACHWIATRLHSTEVFREVYSCLQELAYASGGTQETLSRNLESTFFYHPSNYIPTMRSTSRLEGREETV